MAGLESFYCQLTTVASYYSSAMSVVIVRCQKSYYKEQWMVGVADEDCINHRGTTVRNGRPVNVAITVHRR